jgi:hypothetical protein
LPIVVKRDDAERENCEGRNGREWFYDDGLGQTGVAGWWRAWPPTHLHIHLGRPFTTLNTLQHPANHTRCFKSIALLLLTPSRASIMSPPRAQPFLTLTASNHRIASPEPSPIIISQLADSSIVRSLVLLRDEKSRRPISY